MKHIESEKVKVYWTNDYGRFKFLKGNRDIIEHKVKSIIKDVKEGINFLPFAPIVVNENMEIIDGQHRFVVSQQLKDNVYYIIAKETSIPIVPKINSKHSRWKAVDFLNSFIDMGKEPYMELKKFLNVYPSTNISTAFKLFPTGTIKGDGAREAFEDGVMKDTHKDVAYKLACLLKDMEDFCDNPFSSRMYQALMKLEGNGKYDHELMLNKFVESGRKLQNYKSGKEIIEAMESIINHKSRNKINIY